MISQDIVTQVKELTDLVEVVSDFVTLKRKGQNLVSPCPFHQEKTPSFVVSPAKGIYKCFGCGKSGDAIQFIMDIEGLTYMDTIRYLARKYGIELKEETVDYSTDQQREKESILIALHFAASYFQDILWKNPHGSSIGLSYFKERGLSEPIIKKFQLGYSLDEWDAFLRYAVKNNYQIDILQKADLINQQGDKKYDRFRGRIIFPIHQVNGRVVGFGARILKNEKNQAKYINSSESEVYHKSKILYGLFQAKQAIRQEDLCYLVEGYMDVLMLNQGGVENVVASSGTSLTKDQIKLIGRHTSNITILYDGDQAGLQASSRGVDMILEEGLNVRIVLFPDGEDPDSFLRKVGAVEFKKYIISNVQDFVTFKTQISISNTKNDPIQKAEIIRSIVESIVKIPDSIKRSLYYKQCSQLLGIDELILIAEGNKISLAASKTNKTTISDADDVKINEASVTQAIEKSTDDQLYIHEREVIKLVIRYGDHLINDTTSLTLYMLNELVDIEFESPMYQSMLEILRQTSTHQSLLQTHDEFIKKEIAGILSEKYELSENWIKKYLINTPTEENILLHAAYTAVLRLKLKQIRKLIKENSLHIAQAVSIEEQNQQLKIKMELKQFEKQIADELGIIVG